MKLTVLEEDIIAKLKRKSIQKKVIGELIKLLKSSKVIVIFVGEKNHKF